MRRALLTAAAAAVTTVLAACGPEVITLTEADVFPIQIPQAQLQDFKYLSSGAVAAVGRETGGGPTVVSVHSFTGNVSRSEIEQHTVIRIITAGARAFLVVPENGHAARYAGEATVADSAGLTYSLAGESTAGGALGVIGYQTSGTMALTVWDAAGGTTFPQNVSSGCFGECTPQWGFGLADNFAVSMRDIGTGAHIVVMNHNGNSLGAPVDTVSRSSRFKELNDTTLLVYEPDGNGFSSGHVLTLSAAGARLSKVPLPASLTSTSTQFTPDGDGVLIYLPADGANPTNRLIRANRPWNWTSSGQIEGLGVGMYSPMPDGSMLIREGTGIGRGVL